MRILMLSGMTEGTGNATAARRIGGHLLHAGHDVRYIPLQDQPPTSGVQEESSAWNAEHSMGIHMTKSGEYLQAIGLPYTVIAGGTDLNVDILQEQKRVEIVRTLERATHIVVRSPVLKKKAASLIPTSQRIVTIPQATNVHPSAYSIRKALKLSRDSLLFLLVASLRHVKDPIFLVPAFLEWHRRNPRIHLAIAGPALEENIAHAIQERCSTHPSLHYLGVLQSSDLHAAIRDSTALINSSLSEGCSNAILEAMTLGTPVIARRNEGNSAIITEEETGLLFETPEEFLEKAEKLMTNPTLISSLTLNAMHFIDLHHNIATERRMYQTLFSAT